MRIAEVTPSTVQTLSRNGLSEKQVVVQFKIPLNRLRNSRRPVGHVAKVAGPPYYLAPNGRVRYLASEVQAWLDAGGRRSGSGFADIVRVDPNAPAAGAVTMEGSR